MFTGIIEQIGVVREVRPDHAGVGAGVRLVIEAPRWPRNAQPLQPGESIALNGCCLTLARRADDDLLGFDVVHQTLRMTTLGEWREGDPVHLERAATPATLLGGHLVQGHIDGVGSAIRSDRIEGEHRLRITCAVDVMQYLVPRGSVAVDGVSLTIADLGDNWFEVALVPTTLERTTFARIGRSDPTRVNIEADQIAKTVMWMVRRGEDSPLRITEDH